MQSVLNTAERAPSGLSWRVGLLAASALPCIAAAQPWVTFDASLGSPPQSQCWQEVVDVNPPASPPRGIIGGALHLNTTGLGSNMPENNGGAVYWRRSDVAFAFSEAFAFEARVRIAAAADRTTNPNTGWPRPGYALALYDRDGRIFWIGLGSSEVFLSNTAFGQYGGASTLTVSFNTTDAFHTYRLERAPGGVGARLLIDGVPRLTLAALGPIEGSGGLCYFGDPTYWANSESSTAWVRFSGSGNGPITGISGPAAAVACPSGAVVFSVTAVGSGPFTYQWQVRGAGAACPWTNVVEGPNPPPCGGPGAFVAVGAQAAAVAVNGEVWNQPSTFRCTVTNACGEVVSNPATLTICIADTDDGSGTGTCDGGVTIDDLLYYLGLFDAGLLAADVDDGSGTGSPDGGVTIDDLLYYLARFDAGC